MSSGFWYYDGSGHYPADSADEARKHAIDALDSLRARAAGEIWADWVEDIGWGAGLIKEHGIVTATYTERARERIVHAHECDHPHRECDEGECECEVPQWCDAITDYDLVVLP